MDASTYVHAYADGDAEAWRDAAADGDAHEDTYARAHVDSGAYVDPGTHGDAQAHGYADTYQASGAMDAHWHPDYRLTERVLHAGRAHVLPGVLPHR